MRADTANYTLNVLRVIPMVYYDHDDLVVIGNLSFTISASRVDTILVGG